MGFFGKKSEGGLMDVIRCDEEKYLVWKWSPSGVPSAKENAIRFGSSLRVKQGEVAVFVYKDEGDQAMDFIEGPCDETIRTANFPVLTRIVGAAFGGNSPFQAEIYFINLQTNNQIPFETRWFRVFDYRSDNIEVPLSVGGTLTFNITDYRGFIQLNRLRQFNLQDFKEQIRNVVLKSTKQIVANASTEFQIPVLQLERRIAEISDMIQQRVAKDLEGDFGINLRRFDVGSITPDEEDDSYRELKVATSKQELKMSVAASERQNLDSNERARIQRKDEELQVEGRNLAAHQIDQQANVLTTFAESSSGFNPSKIVAGVTVGAAFGNRMAGMVDSVPPPPASPAPPPPPPPTATHLYHIALNGQQSGPFALAQLEQMALAREFTRDHHVWRTGMSGWESAGSCSETSGVFGAVPPPLPV